LTERLHNGKSNNNLFILTINRKKDIAIIKEKLYDVSFPILQRKKEILDNFDFNRK